LSTESVGFPFALAFSSVLFCQGDTPLHVSAQRGSKQTLRVLIERGADVAAKTRAGKTPRDLATEKEVIDLLDSAKV
jgi:ankyrin repeat protein